MSMIDRGRSQGTLIYKDFHTFLHLKKKEKEECCIFLNNQFDLFSNHILGEPSKLFNPGQAGWSKFPTLTENKMNAPLNKGIMPTKERNIW